MSMSPKIIHSLPIILTLHIILAFIILSVSVLGGLWSSTVEAADITTGLVGYWPLDEGMGTTTIDISGHANTGALMNNPTWLSTAKINRGLSFGGVADFIQIANQNNFNFGTGNFTISAWAKLNQNSDIHNAFVAKGLTVKNYPGYFLGEYYGNIAFRLENAMDNGDPVQVAVKSAHYKGTWHHYAGVREGDSIRLYIDGTLATSTTLAGHYTSSFKPDNTNPLSIGAAIYFTKSLFMDGAIDDVRVYNIALSDADMIQVYDFGHVSPSTPINFSAKAVDTSWTRLSWNVPTSTDPIAEYQIYRDGSLIATTTRINSEAPGDFRTYEDTGLTAETAYSYYMLTVDSKENISHESPSISITMPSARSGLFPLYDLISYKEGQPNFKQYGFSDIAISNSGIVTEEQAREIARSATKGKYLIIDNEAWDLIKDMDKYIQEILWMKDENPEIKVGYYGGPPLRDYWAPVLYLNHPSNATYRQKYNDWKANNNSLARLAAYVDAIFPSIYTFYDNQTGWEMYATENIKEALQYGKPVFPFIWPRFENGQYTDGRPLPPAYWRAELDLVKRLGADGVIVWDGGSPLAWDNNFPWFVDTLNFIAKRTSYPVPSKTFAIGDRIETLNAANVYGTPNGASLGQQVQGHPGFVMAGPVSKGGKIWWNIDYNSGTDGWTSEDVLKKSSFQGLLAEWNFEESSGKAYDSTVQNFTAFPVNGASRTSGRVGLNAMNFDGVDDYLNAGAQTQFNFGTGNFTISAWAKLNQNSDIHNAFVAKGLTVKNYPGYFLGEYYGNIAFRLENAMDNGDPVQVAVKSAHYKGTWHHYAGVREGDSIRLYIDGTLATSTTLAGHYTSSFKPDNTNPLSIGAAIYFTKSLFMDGAIDDVRVYNVALDQLQVRKLSEDVASSTNGGGGGGSSASITTAPFTGGGSGSGGGGLGTIVTSSPTPLSTTPSSSSPTSFVFYRTLSRGTRGEDVSELQYFLALNPSIYPEGDVTGFFGVNTMKAVQRFQCRYGIVCSGDESSSGYGVMGKITRAKIAELTGAQGKTDNQPAVPPIMPAVPVSSTVFTRNLNLGDRGEDVRALQQFLNAQKFTIVADGPGSSGNETDYFGKATRASLVRFQNAHRDEILLPADITTGSGYFGAFTKREVQLLLSATN